jgi:hypothetical protein
MAGLEFEFYTLDDSLRKKDIIEDLLSAIWTERYNAFGDFQFTLISTRENRQMLQKKTRIAMNMSKYIMTVATVLDKTDESGIRTIVVSGKSLEALLQDRAAMPAITDTTTSPSWVVTGKPGDIMRYMFNQICVNCVLSEHDNIPFYTPGTLLPPGNIPESTDLITVSASPDSLYNTIKSIGDTYYLGFRLVRNGDLGQVYFEVYTGDDRTLSQTVKDPVVFDPNTETLDKVSILTSDETEKTVAYVFAANGSAVVYSPLANQSDSGSDRRVLVINSSNSNEAGADLTAALKQEGLVALAAQRSVYAFDGEMAADAAYVYGRDYRLGDLVEERDSDNFGNQLLVIEQIFSVEKAGNSSYPTLSIAQVLTPGTWLTLDPGLDWTSIDPALDWVDFG